ncbi:MAG: hypothetical protein Tsb0020_11140 [Haliangiales bacterium]
MHIDAAAATHEHVSEYPMSRIDTTPPSAGSSDSAEVSSQLSTPALLLVEDNEDDYLLVDGFLSASDYALSWASTAAEARAKLAQQRFDLVLLDHGLPDTNGLSFLEELRAEHPAIPVIVLTGRNDQALALSAMRMGAHSYLLKDEIIEHLEEAVSEVLASEVPNALDPVAVGTDSATKPKFMDTADRFYQTLLDTMGEGCLVVDASGIITFANPAVDELIRPSAGKLLGRYVRDVFAPESRAAVLAGLEQLTSGRSPRAVVHEAVLTRALTTDAPSSVTTVRISMRAIYSPDDHFEAGLLMLSDISELLRARQLLTSRYEQERIQHTQMRAILEASRDGILLIDGELRILVVNGPAIQLLGLSGDVDSWTSRSLVEFVRAMRYESPTLARRALGEFRRIRRGDHAPRQGEVPSGARTVRWLSLPVRDTDSRLLVLQDISAEHRLQQLRNDLVHMAVHDLRNPLTVIWASLTQVRDELCGPEDDALDSPPTGSGDDNAMSADANSGVDTSTPADADSGADTRAEVLDSALLAANRMLTLVNYILDVNRLEAGVMPIERRDCALADVVSRAQQVQAALARARAVTLTHSEPSSDSAPGQPWRAWRAWIDTSLIERVLQNILDNAIRCTPAAGRVELHVERCATPEPQGHAIGRKPHSGVYSLVGLTSTGPVTSADMPLPVADSAPGYYRLIVSDQGPGIPDSLEERLFERYTTSAAQGVGLGLAFCKLAVEAHGGCLWAERNPDGGTRFCFTVPAARRS